MPNWVFSSVAACALFARPAFADDTQHVLHINDLHSCIESVDQFDPTCNSEDEAKGECFGGVARLAAQISALRDQIRAEGGNVIVLDAGASVSRLADVHNLQRRC